MPPTPCLTAPCATHVLNYEGTGVAGAAHVKVCADALLDEGVGTVSAAVTAH